MVLLPPAGTTWHRHSSLSAAPGHRRASAGFHKAVPSPIQLTTCLGLTRYRWSEGSPSCPCRTTEMICGVLQLLSACHQDVSEAHAGSKPTGHTWAASPPCPRFSQPGQLHGWTQTR